jgi:tight adherence protein C
MFAALSVFATVITLLSAYFDRDRLGARIKAVALEREQIRARERARLAAEGKRASLRNEPKVYMRRIVDRLNLRTALADEGTIAKLRMAGYRGQAPLVVFLFARATRPIAFLLAALIYLFWILEWDQPTMIKVCVALGIAYVGFYAPILYVSNVVTKRQTSIRRAWPDALDLMLICVESGMSAEAAFRKVSEEIGVQSIPLAEELTLVTAELSYLQDRRQAYENLSLRTGLEGVRAVMTSLIQAERYGTPLGTALRVLAQENRDQRMNEAEEESRCAAAQAYRADDRFLPAGASRRDRRPGGDPTDGPPLVRTGPAAALAACRNGSIRDPGESPGRDKLRLGADGEGRAKERALHGNDSQSDHPVGGRRDRRQCRGLGHEECRPRQARQHHRRGDRRSWRRPDPRNAGSGDAGCRGRRRPRYRIDRRSACRRGAGGAILTIIADVEEHDGRQNA